MKPTTWGALLWMGCLQFFIAEAIAALAWRGAYSYSRNFISDLGALSCPVDSPNPGCSPVHALMNASFALQGVLILGGALLVAPILWRGWLSRIGLALIGASGFGVFVVGLAPEDVAPGWHYFGAAENFLFCNLGMALLGLGLLANPPRGRAIGFVATASGAVGLAALACLAKHLYFGFGVGVVERVVAYPFPLTIAVVGAWLASGSVAEGA